MNLLSKKNFFILLSIVLIAALFCWKIFEVGYEYYPNGEKESKIILNHLTGKAYIIEYHDDGNMKSKYQMVNSKREGEYLEYYSNGQLKNKKHYSNGLIEGPYIGYHSDGNLFYKGEYQNGKITGDIKFFDSNGSFKGINRYYENRLYYKKLFMWGKDKNVVDTVREILPIIDLKGIDDKGDTIKYEITIISENTPYSQESLIVRYDLFIDTIMDETETVTLPYPRFNFDNIDLKKEKGKFTIPFTGDRYFYGWLELCSPKDQEPILKEFLIKLPKEKFDIDYPSKDTSFVIY